MKTETKVYPEDCPICGIQTNYTYGINDGKDRSVWYKCPCGVLFQQEEPERDVYDKSYIAEYLDKKEAKLVCIHSAKTYAPLIEELVYGRKMLDVGFAYTYNMEFFRERGWIANGIELNKEYDKFEDIIIGDFEKQISLKHKYNLIWMGHVLECFENPIQALQKTYNIMPEDGVLYIATPDIDFITKTGVSGWGHFKKREHKVLWSERALVRELERIGFNIVMKRRNFSQRFSSHYDIHLVCQKRFF